MLRAQRTALRSGGKVACLVIEIAPELDPRSHRRARRVAPPHAATSSTYPSMLGTAGLVDVEAIDLTAEYRTTKHAWMTERRRRADDYGAVIGADEFVEKMAADDATLRGIDDGLLRRTLYVARRR